MCGSRRCIEEGDRKEEPLFAKLDTVTLWGITWQVYGGGVWAIFRQSFIHPFARSLIGCMGQPTCVVKLHASYFMHTHTYI